MPMGKGTYGSKVGRPPKKQGQKDREDEKLAMEVKGLKNKAQKKTMKKGAGSWLAHVRKVRKPGESWKAALKRASASYKK
jgi:hypothetical protein